MERPVRGRYSWWERREFRAVNGGHSMSTTEMIAIVLIVLVVIGVAAVYILQFNRTKRLRDRFGPEYDRTLNETGDKREAEAKLQRLEKRVERLHVRALEASERARFVEAWREIQARFVDNPKGALIDADRLIGEVMSAEGYPVLDFQQRAADVSVDHPHVAENYRAGHRIALLHAQGRASTEDLRRAVIHYRTLVDELLGTEAATQRGRQETGETLRQETRREEVSRRVS
jgi:hypothetical protein